MQDRHTDRLAETQRAEVTAGMTSLSAAVNGSGHSCYLRASIGERGIETALGRLQAIPMVYQAESGLSACSRVHGYVWAFPTCHAC